MSKNNNFKSDSFKYPIAIGHCWNCDYDWVLDEIHEKLYSGVEEGATFCRTCGAENHFDKKYLNEVQNDYMYFISMKNVVNALESSIGWWVNAGYIDQHINLIKNFIENDTFPNYEIIKILNQLKDFKYKVSSGYYGWFNPTFLHPVSKRKSNEWVKTSTVADRTFARLGYKKFQDDVCITYRKESESYKGYFIDITFYFESEAIIVDSEVGESVLNKVEIKAVAAKARELGWYRD